MTDDITRAASATVDSGAVRFTVFFEVRGPQVFEIPGELLRNRFGATGMTAEQLLTAFRQSEREILAVARACHMTAPGTMIRLDATAFDTYCGSVDDTPVVPGSSLTPFN